MSHITPSILAAFLLAALTCRAQSSPALTPDDLKYFGFMLTQVAGVDNGPKAQVDKDRTMFHLYGLNSQEIAILRGASMELRALMRQLSPVARSIMPDATGKLSAANQAALSALAAQRDQKVEQLANRILSQVRPQVAALFRLNGRILATRGNLGSLRR